MCALVWTWTWTCIKRIGCTTRLLMLGGSTCVDVWWEGLVVCEGVDGMQPGTENVLGVDDKKSPHGEVPKCIWARSRAPPLSSLFNFSSSCYTLPCPTRETLHVNHLVLLVHCIERTCNRSEWAEKDLRDEVESMICFQRLRLSVNWA